MRIKITILGAGSWGTALAHVFALRGHHAVILARRPEITEEISRRRTNERYLPGVSLHSGLWATADPAAALQDAAIVILAVPCQSMRGCLRSTGNLFPRGAAIICASKGLEKGSHALMSQVVAEELPHLADNYAILSGPSFAKEVVEGAPTAVVLGCADASLAAMLRRELSSAMFRVYSNPDVIGVECGGALKNVMALAAGMADGLGFGHNSRAALITRGLAEMSRLGVALGGSAATFMGLSGMGDLVLTATGDLSRNRQVGIRLGKGESLEDIIASMRHVAEGVPTTEAVYDLARSLGIDLPITFAMRSIILGETDPRTAVRELMRRELKDE